MKVALFISVERQTFCDENNIPSLRSQSWDIAQYPGKKNQSNCAILGGSRCVASTNSCYSHYLPLPRGPGLL